MLALLAPCIATLLGQAEPDLRLTRATKGCLAFALGLAALLTATGSLVGALLGWILVALVAAAALAYERRLRRRGGTLEARALGALRAMEGPGFVEDGDVADERERVRRDVARAGGVGGVGRGDTDGNGPAVVISGLRKVYAPRGRAPPKVAALDPNPPSLQPDAVQPATLGGVACNPRWRGLRPYVSPRWPWLT